MITVVLSQRKWKKTISWPTTVGLFHILHCFPNHSRHIAMLRIAIPRSLSNTSSNTSRKAAMRWFLAFKPLISTMKLPAIKLVDMWTAMRRFGVIPRLYIWRCIWRMGNEFILPHRMFPNKLKQQHWRVSLRLAKATRLPECYFTKRCHGITLGTLQWRNFNAGSRATRFLVIRMWVLLMFLAVFI